jgi:hypothetical protein
MTTVKIEATKADGSACSYIGTVGTDGWIYFNDYDFYRFQPKGTWEDTQQIRNRTRSSWVKTQMFAKLSTSNLNSGGGSVASDPGVEEMVNYAIDIANDDSHGYDWGSRWGPDYDCSSLLLYSAKKAGFNVYGSSPYGNTQTMVQQFTDAGWTWHAGMGNSVDELQRGDILLNINAHTEMYIGNQQNVGAHINELGDVYGGRTGDQTGKEICVDAWYSYPWDGVLRYGG